MLRHAAMPESSEKSFQTLQPSQASNPSFQGLKAFRPVSGCPCNPSSLWRAFLHFHLRIPALTFFDRIASFHALLCYAACVAALQFIETTQSAVFRPCMKCFCLPISSKRPPTRND